MLQRLTLLYLLLMPLAYAQTITIAVAANVSYAMDALQEEFHKSHPDTHIRVIIGGSGKLTAQIMNGAPYMLFISADMLYPQALYKRGIATTLPHLYAKGALAYFSTTKRDFSQGIKLLQDASITKIAIANPKSAPYGKAAFEAIQSAGILKEIQHKFVYGESISQTLSYTMRATDIGIIAASALYSKRMKQFQKGSNWFEVDTSLYTPIQQGIVILKRGEHSSDVQAFYNFMLSQRAKKVLHNFGYIVE